MAKADLTAARLRELLHYDPQTGVFMWRTTGKGRPDIGSHAGNVDRGLGYRLICVDYHRRYAHRLAFLYMNGGWPDGLVDHINGDRADNRRANLRVGDRRLNQENMRRAAKGSASGLIGAHKKRDRWSAQIQTHGKLIKLGVFATAQQAHEAYVAAKRKFHRGCTI